MPRAVYLGAAVLLLLMLPRRASASMFSLPGFRRGGFVVNVESYLERHEGRVPYVYKDQAGLDTFGVGHRLTAADGYLRQYTKANPAPDSLVSEILSRDAAAAVAAVDGLGVKLTENQRTAFVSLAFNIGAGAFRSSSAARYAKAGNMQAAADAITAWNKVRNPKTGALVIASGLASRRADERALFLA